MTAVSRVFVWRHGQTTWNASDRLQGHAEDDLDEVGRAQARSAAVTLAAYRPDLIVSSDLRRAADTAAALSAATGLPVRLDPRLRERHLGAWQGMLASEIQAAHPEQFARWRRGEPVGCGIEDLDVFAKRVGAATLDAVTRADGGTVVLTTHGGASRHVIGELLGWPREITRSVAGLDNCHWSELVLRDSRGWTLRAHNVGLPPVIG